jgi:outer membrane protein OmpA-like peptidoglycan-associated protein
MHRATSLLLTLAALGSAADLPGSKDPPGMKRYEGSEIIGYRAPKFDEYVLPLSAPTEVSPPKYPKSLSVDGQISRHTYVAGEGRTATELLRNYRLEFQRLGLEVLYEKKAGERGWFGPAFSRVEEEDGLGQILEYNEADERLLVGKTREAKPSYYAVFVTSYKDGIIPERLQGVVKPGRALATVVAITPGELERKMTFVNALEMKKQMGEAGKITLYGIQFDTGEDVLKPESHPTIAEITKLLGMEPSLKLHVVGHTDNQGKTDYNLDLSRRRAATIVRVLTSQGVAAGRLDSFGCGVYAPVASNETEEGRAQNRRVELIRW